MSSYGTAISVSPKASHKRKTMKTSFRQKLRNWILNDNADSYANDSIISVEESKFNSEGMRLQVYRASGGFVIETRHYNRRKDENMNAMFVITEDQDLGEEIGKIITMETLKS
jgi:hypothetical protein